MGINQPIYIEDEEESLYNFFNTEPKSGFERFRFILEYENIRREYIINKEAFEALWDLPRRPVYAIRGKTLTPQRAREIITDKEIDTEPFFINHWLIKEDGGSQSTFDKNSYGWLHTNGYIGINHYSYDKNPYPREVLDPCAELATKYPDLDMILVLTDRDELLQRKDGADHRVYGPFRDAVKVGLLIKDGKVEVMHKGKAWLLFKSYDRKYGRHDLRYFRHNKIGVGIGTEILTDPEVIKKLKNLQTETPEFISYPSATDDITDVRDRDFSDSYYVAEYNSVCYNFATKKYIEQMKSFLNGETDNPPE